MFKLGVLVIVGTVTYAAITGEWPDPERGKWYGTGIPIAVGVWMMYAPIRDWIWGGKKQDQTVK